jgi:arsenite methyltransferase
MAAGDRPDYGLDAPGVVRNLLIVAAGGLLLWISPATGLWSGELAFSPSSGVHIVIPLARMAFWPAAGCGLMALWMIWDSKVGKVRGRKALLQQVPWNGAERVLDVGCGRGLMLIGAAKRLSTGTATGIDIWQAEDLSGNRPEATLENAQREGVADRVEIKTSDMRDMPFPDATFDIVVSSAAIHNLYSADDRGKAIREIVRVLKPGGHAVIDDIRHGAEYGRAFLANGCTVRSTGSRVVSSLLTVITMGSLRPATLVVRKKE